MKKLFKYTSVAVCSISVLAVGVLLYGGMQWIKGKERNLTAVIIENHEAARPNHAGLEDALIVEEWLVEGSISRLVAVFDVNHLPAKVGPVRSIRPYFLEALFPWNLVVFHAGGSPQALAIIGNTNILKSANGIGHYNNLFERDEDLYAPHNLFIQEKNMQTILEEFGAQKKSVWPPYKEGSAQPAPRASTIGLNFFNINHNVEYEYEFSTERYTRTNGEEISKAHPKNILILEMPIRNILEEGRLDIPVQGRGRAILFRSGRMYEAHWTKNTRDHAFSFTDAEDEPLIFAHGQTWMTVLPTLERVSWEQNEEQED